MKRRDLFGGWYMGWIARGPYLGALVVWLVLLVPLWFAGVEAAPLTFRDFGGWGSQVKAAHSVAAATWYCFVLNLIARRFRDAGLPGWAMAGIVAAAGFGILRHFLSEEMLFALPLDRVTEEGLLWAGAWTGAMALVAAALPTDLFPWVVDRDRWAVFD